MNKQAGLSLIAVSVLFMLIGCLAMASLFYMRYGHLPLPEWLQNRGLSAAPAGAIGQALKTLPVDKSNLPVPVTIESGVRHCQINGKTVYSDIECQHRQDSQVMKLHDTQGFVKPPPENKSDDVTASDADLRLKLMDQAIDKSHGKAAAGKP